MTLDGISILSDFGTDPQAGRTPWQSLCTAIANPGSYTLQFLIADQALTEFKGGGFLLKYADIFAAASSTDGSRLVFRSTGDYQSDNPSLQEQIWIATENGTVYDVSRLTAAVNADFDEPEIR